MGLSRPCICTESGSRIPFSKFPSLGSRRQQSRSNLIELIGKSSLVNLTDGGKGSKANGSAVDSRLIGLLQGTDLSLGQTSSSSVASSSSTTLDAGWYWRSVALDLPSPSPSTSSSSSSSSSSFPPLSPFEATLKKLHLCSGIEEEWKWRKEEAIEAVQIGGPLPWWVQHVVEELKWQNILRGGQRVEDTDAHKSEMEVAGWVDGPDSDEQVQIELQETGVYGGDEEEDAALEWCWEKITPLLASESIRSRRVEHKHHLQQFFERLGLVSCGFKTLRRCLEALQDEQGSIEEVESLLRDAFPSSVLNPNNIVGGLYIRLVEILRLQLLEVEWCWTQLSAFVQRGGFSSRQVTDVEELKAALQHFGLIPNGLSALTATVQALRQPCNSFSQLLSILLWTFPDAALDPATVIGATYLRSVQLTVETFHACIEAHRQQRFG
ncbi:unnamed protein product [Sympodiomycopsis kandeliae]